MSLTHRFRRKTRKNSSNVTYLDPILTEPRRGTLFQVGGEILVDVLEYQVERHFLLPSLTVANIKQSVRKENGKVNDLFLLFSFSHFGEWKNSSYGLIVSSTLLDGPFNSVGRSVGRLEPQKPKGPFFQNVSWPVK